MMLPEQASDCHMHVFGPFAHYPLAAQRAYTVAEATLDAHERMKRRVGLERTVLVQASAYGEDNRAMLSALKALGDTGRAVAVLQPKASIAEAQNLHGAGVRGLRLNLVTTATRFGEDPASLFGDYERLCEPLGWHLQVYATGKTLEALEPLLERARVPVVLDHMGGPEAAAGTAQPGFQALLRLMRKAHVWAKLAGADRITRATGRLRDAVPFMRALAEVAPERLVWGTDWPHIGFNSGQPVQDDAVLPYRDVDAAELLAVLFEAVREGAAIRAILSDNPARLYR